MSVRPKTGANHSGLGPICCAASLASPGLNSVISSAPMYGRELA
jgi:hypothetical protein